MNIVSLITYQYEPQKRTDDYVKPICKVKHLLINRSKGDIIHIYLKKSNN